MQFKTIARLSLGVAALALAAPGLTQSKTGPVYGSFGIDRTAADTSVKPGDDFWAYANGGWDKRTEIAPDRTSAGVGVKLVDQAELQVRDILTDAQRDPASIGPGGKQIGDLYASWMDEAGIEARGTAPLKPYLAKIAAANDRAKLQTLFATTGYASPIGIGQIPSPANPTEYAVFMGQGSLGMGGRDYYLLEGAKYDAFRAGYRDYLTKIQTLAGIKDAAARTDRIMALETAMAKVQWSPIEMRDLAKMIRPMGPAQRNALVPQFDIAGMLRTAGYGEPAIVNMGTSTALVELGKLFAATPVSTWQEWLAARFISSNAQFLPKAFDEANFAFYGKLMRDQPEQRARWKRGVALVNNAMGEAVGAAYVRRHYPAESQAQMGELIANLRAAYKDRLEGNAWMDPATKEKALAKLAAFDPRIGHPEKYIDYSALQVSRTDLLGNAMRAADFQHQLDLSRYPNPVDRSLWNMTPQTVNAYYNPLQNQITFPAAILQPPYFDPKADPAVNYASIGGVIGHEMGHGFDDQGSKFSASGKFENWWTPEARKAFETRTAALVQQYDAFEPIPGTKVKGALTLGENIGDLGGLEVAYAAYQKYQAKHGKAPVIDGLTGDQRFFLAYAQSWQTKRREGALRQQVLTDPHSPDNYRVNGVVRNVDAWYAAFDVKPGDKLYLPPEQRVRIW